MSDHVSALDAMTVLSRDEADELLRRMILTDEGRQDPYAAYDMLRASRPRHDSAVGTVVVTRYEDCLELLRSPKWGRPEPGMELSGSLFREREPNEVAQSLAMLFMNPPGHTRVRSPFARTFTPKRVEELRTNVRRQLEPILERLDGAGPVDVMDALALPLPIGVISELIGVPETSDIDMRTLVRAATANIDPSSDEAALDTASAAIAEMAVFFIELCAHKRQHPDDRLLSALLRIHDDEDGLSFEELIANILLLYSAGFETTSNLIGNGLRALLLHPDQLAMLRSEPGLVPSAVLEILRWDSPVQINGRTALVDTELFGAPVQRGQTTMVLQGAGNTDPEAYDQPRAFRVDRFEDPTTPQPLSFGWGAHHCLGAHLARAEGEEVFGALLARYPHIAAVGSAPRYRASTTLRGLEAFTVEFA